MATKWRFAKGRYRQHHQTALMKNILFILMGLFTLVTWAQQEVLLNKNIQAVKVSAGIEIKLITDAEQNKIEADNLVLEAINYKVKNYELNISLPLGKIIEGDLPLILKVYTKDIDQLNAIQGSIVEIQNTVESSSFSIRATEGSVVSGNFNTENLELKALSGAIIDISGKSESLDILVNTGGKYNGKNLKTKNTIVKVTYGGNAEVFATEKCEANIVVGGNIDIYGNPKYMHEKKSFGGNINIVDK